MPSHAKRAWSRGVWNRDSGSRHINNQVLLAVLICCMGLDNLRFFTYKIIITPETDQTNHARFTSRVRTWTLEFRLAYKTALTSWPIEFGAISIVAVVSTTHGCLFLETWLKKMAKKDALDTMGTRHPEWNLLLQNKQSIYNFFLTTGESESQMEKLSMLSLNRDDISIREWG